MNATNTTSTAVIPVPYQTPAARAVSAATRASIAAFVAALLVAIIPLVLDFLSGGDFSRGAARSLLVSVCIAALTLVLAYAHKYRSANADDTQRLTQPSPFVAANNGVPQTLDAETFETFAAAIHERWIVENRRNGVTTAISRLTGEEQMVPYDDLSDTVKEYDRMMVRTFLHVLATMGYLLVPAHDEHKPPTVRVPQEMLPPRPPDTRH